MGDFEWQSRSVKIYKKVKSLLGRPMKLRSLTSSSPLWLAFCFLGATSHSTIRKFSVKDDWYLGWAETWIKGRFIFGLSKCTYGWLGCGPGLTAVNFGSWPSMLKTWTIWPTLGVGLLCLVKSSRRCHCVVIGGLCLRSTKKGQDTWRYQAGTPLGTLCKWLHDHGWIVQSLGIWKHGETSLTVSIE